MPRLSPAIEGLLACCMSLRAAATSALRTVPLVLAPRPQTTLRVLCIAAFDTLHLLRRRRPLSRATRHSLAALLDHGASANAALDHKDFSPSEFRTTRTLVEQGGLRSLLADYSRRLATLESARPTPAGEFRPVQAYRESVVRLSLAALSAAAGLFPSLDDALPALSSDPDLHLLFRIVMLCQIIDDLLDFPADRAAALPTFLTASASLPESLHHTRLAARRYAACPDAPAAARLHPFRLALALVSVAAYLVSILFRVRRSADILPRRAAATPSGNPTRPDHRALVRTNPTTFVSAVHEAEGWPKVLCLTGRGGWPRR